MMDAAAKQHFDFSLDAMAFKERLARQLQLDHQEIQVLEDEELEFLHAAGTGMPFPEKDELI